MCTSASTWDAHSENVPFMDERPCLKRELKYRRATPLNASLTHDLGIPNLAPDDKQDRSSISMSSYQSTSNKRPRPSSASPLLFLLKLCDSKVLIQILQACRRLQRLRALHPLQVILRQRQDDRLAGRRIASGVDAVAASSDTVFEMAEVEMLLLPAMRLPVSWSGVFRGRLA